MTAAAVAPSLLTPEDQAMFGRLGILPDLLAEARVKRVSDSEARNDFGIKGSPSMDMGGVIFPYYTPAVDHRVTARLRRDKPEMFGDKPQNKYISPWGDKRHLYFPPQAAEKLKVLYIPIVLVEAEKSVLAITAWAERAGMELCRSGWVGAGAGGGPLARRRTQRGSAWT
jgi:hypothetical protein